MAWSVVAVYLGVSKRRDLMAIRHLLMIFRKGDLTSEDEILMDKEMDDELFFAPVSTEDDTMKEVIAAVNRDDGSISIYCCY